MAKPKSKPWSKIIEEHGVKVRLFERGGVVYRDFVTGRRVKSKKSGKLRSEHDVKCLGTSDRTYAEKLARAFCVEVARARLTGASAGDLTLLQLFTVYRRERGPLLSDSRKRDINKAADLWTRHVGADFPVADLGEHQVQTYIAARMDGTLVATGGNHVRRKVRAGTIAKELGTMHAMLNWATRFKRNGRPLLDRNPIHGVPLPMERNPARPVASRERFEKLIEHADAVDPHGVFRAMLNVAWFTGRRLGSIVALRASDVLLTPDQVQRALAASGMDERIAEHWRAAVRWVAEADKEGVEWIVPIPDALRNILATYIVDRGLVGNALLFPARRDSSKPVSKETCYYWIRRAEELAGLPHQYRGGWHALRRAWATARKALPIQDVMLAGGWRDPKALQRAYQHADPATVRAVMDVGT